MKGKRILIVEDNPLHQKLAMALLKNEGFYAQVAENGQIAVDVLKKESFDIILMNIQMPALDGYQSTKKIRLELGLNTPIIAMTANALAEERERCIAVGMDDYSTKPFEPESLLNIIYRFLNTGNTNVVNNVPEKKFTDLGYMKEFSDGRASFVKEMIGIFLEQTPADLAAIEKGLAENNYDEIRTTAHNLQTSLAFIGFPAALINSIKEVEVLAASKQQFGLITEKLGVIVDGCHKAQAELREELRSMMNNKH